MEVKRIDVLPHARDPAGSYAVIKLFGITRLEGPATYRMEPVGHNNQRHTYSDWPDGDLKPLGVRAGADSVELLIGPDIVSAAALKPGTEVKFTMSSAGVDTNIVWPNLSHNGAVVDATPAVTLPDQPNIPPPIAVATASHQAVGDDEKGLARLRPRASGDMPVTPMPAPATAREQSSHALTIAAPATTKPVVQPTRIAAYSGWRDSVAAEPVAETTATPVRSPATLLPLALGLVIVAAMLIIFMRTTSINGSGVTLISALRSSIDGKLAAIPNPLPAEIFGAGSTSPAGVDSSGMSQRDALERANEILADLRTTKDRAEAAFWLRKALSRSLSTPRLVWAVTQLGTAYASADKGTKPNYEAARLLWNWAADAGDAHAACFLGRLFEKGLGVPPNPKLARDHYERARALGGCPGLEQAMLRVRN